MRPDIIDWLAQYIGKSLAVILIPTQMEINLFAVLIAIIIVLRRLHKRGVDIVPYLSASILGYFALIIGGRLGWIFFNLNDYLSNPSKFLNIWEGGFVSFGALGFGALTGLVFLKWKKISFWPFADAFTPGVALVLGVARIGCFFAGCCHGSTTTLWWGVTYRKGRSAWKLLNSAGLLSEDAERSLSVHPTQLLEATLGVLLFFWLSKTWKSQRFEGETFWTFWIVYGLGRFMIEFLRGDSRLMIGYLSAAQVLSLTIFIIGSMQYWLGRKNFNSKTALCPTAIEL
jgi:phosphatidylglycerol---prolipoprotein diacylglyceryl transferase